MSHHEPEPTVKILHIIDTLRSDGAQVFLENFIRKQVETGYSVMVAAVVEGGPIAVSLETMGVPVTIIGKPHRISLQPLLRLHRIIREFRPALIHTHLFAADTYGRIAGRLYGRAVLVTTEHNINRDEGWIKQRIKSVLSRFNDCMVFLNDEVRRYSVETDRVRPRRIAVIGNGIDPDIFYPAPGKQPDPEHLRFLTVGRLEHQKGHEILINAFSLLHRRFPHATLRIIGTGSLESRLREQITALNIQDHVALTGFISREHLPDIYRSSSVFVFPSRFEGQGIALLEAMASGLPCIASDTGGIRSLIEHDLNGILITPLTPENLAKSMMSLVADPARMAQLAEAAHQTSQTHRIEDKMDHYMTLYRYLLEPGQVPPDGLGEMEN